MVKRILRALLALALLGPGAIDARGQQRGAMFVDLADEPGPLPLYRKSFALVIGIDAYSSGWPRLSKAVEDAEAVAAELKARGFEVTLARNLRSDALESTVEDFIFERGKEPEARLLIWFAGHGHTIGDEVYLVPADAPAVRKGGPPGADTEFRRKALSLRRVSQEFMREVRARHVLAIFDSCFSGSVFRVERSVGPPVSISRRVAAPVRQMITSGDDGQTVSDDGLFRRLFLDALSGAEPGADVNDDGYLTGSELGLFLSEKVTSLTEARQTPRFGKVSAYGLDRGDFVFRVGPQAQPDGGRPGLPGSGGVVASPPVPQPRPVEATASAAAPDSAGSVSHSSELLTGALDCSRADTYTRRHFAAERDQYTLEYADGVDLDRQSNDLESVLRVFLNQITGIEVRLWFVREELRGARGTGDRPYLVSIRTPDGRDIACYRAKNAFVEQVELGADGRPVPGSVVEQLPDKYYRRENGQH